MLEKVIIAGAGGQGIMLLGKVLAEAAMRQNKFVTWLPAYGAEVRGGTAHCMVIISDQEIGSPYTGIADSLIIMNRPSVEKFRARIKKRGLVIINTSLSGEDTYKNVQVCKYPFTDIAIKLGNIKVANMVALGCFLAERHPVDLKSVLQAITDIAPEDKLDLIAINKKALQEGFYLTI